MPSRTRPARAVAATRNRGESAPRRFGALQLDREGILRVAGQPDVAPGHQPVLAASVTGMPDRR